WPVTKSRPPETIGEEFPFGSATDQTTPWARPICAGRPRSGDTPVPFGPRNRVQSEAPAVTARAQETRETRDPARERATSCMTAVLSGAPEGLHVIPPTGRPRRTCTANWMLLRQGH